MIKKFLSSKPTLKLTAIWSLLVIFGVTVMNPPQCPSDWHQTGIDTSNCITGANIGLGMYILFVLMPATIVVIALWIIKFVTFFWNPPKPKTKK